MYRNVVHDQHKPQAFTTKAVGCDTVELDRMRQSGIPAVAEIGASWSALVWLYKGHFHDAFNDCVLGSVALRKGVAKVLAEHVTDETVGAKCQPCLPRFFDDPVREVRVASTSFMNKHLDFQAKGVITLLRAYVASKAYLANPGQLLRGLQEFKGDLRPLSQLIFEACDRFTDPTIATHEGTINERGFDIGELSVLLLRLYGQIEPPNDDPIMRKQCLDRWDSILRVGNGTPLSALSLLD